MYKKTMRLIMNFLRSKLMLGLVVSLVVTLSGCTSNQFLDGADSIAVVSAQAASTEIQDDKVAFNNMDSRNISELDLESSMRPPLHRLKIDDVVKFFVWKHPELTHIATVQPDGTLSMPLVGPLYAFDKLPSEISEEAKKVISGVEVSSGKFLFSVKDKVKLQVWNQPDLSHVAEVQLNGMAAFPLAGEVMVAGKSIDNVRNIVASKLEHYLNSPVVSILPEYTHKAKILDPQITILPVKLQPRRIAVMGEVFRAGQQSISGTLQVMEALASAMPKDTAQLNEVILLRSVGGKAVQYKKLNIRDYIDGKAAGQNVYLQAGDVLYVPKSSIAKVGTFVGQFFNATRGVFDWWISLQTARNVQASIDLTEQVNQSLINANSN
jgi:protein involved in polysaccharide export with SLBB domain